MQHADVLLDQVLGAAVRAVHNVLRENRGWWERKFYWSEARTFKPRRQVAVQDKRAHRGWQQRSGPSQHQPLHSTAQHGAAQQPTAQRTLTSASIASCVRPEQSAGCAICAPRKELPPWLLHATCGGEVGGA